MTEFRLVQRDVRSENRLYNRRAMGSEVLKAFAATGCHLRKEETNMLPDKKIIKLEEVLQQS